MVGGELGPRLGGEARAGWAGFFSWGGELFVRNPEVFEPATTSDTANAMREVGTPKDSHEALQRCSVLSTHDIELLRVSNITKQNGDLTGARHKDHTF